MFFILSKILLFLLSPVNWILACVVISFITKRDIIKKRWRIAAFVIFIVFGNFALYNACILAWQPKVEHKAYNTTYSTGIVLTGMTIGNDKNESYFASNADRFLQTARLYHTGVINKIFISGGDGSLHQNKPKEAHFLRDEFIALHVPDSNIIVEADSRNTYESAVAAKHIVDSLKLQPPYLLVTSAIHMPRSLLTFAKAGVSVIPHAANYEMVSSKISWTTYIFPNVGVLKDWKLFLKEVVGVSVYKLTGKA